MLTTHAVEHLQHAFEFGIELSRLIDIDVLQTAGHFHLRIQFCA